jgi:signal transduction histidine kinase
LPDAERARDWPELHAAAAAVVAGLDDVDVAVPTTELSAALAELVEGLEAGVLPPESGWDPAVRRRLLALLQARLVSLWTLSSRPPEAGRMLDVLSRFEAAAVRLDGMIPGARTLGYPTALEFVAGVAHDLRSPLTSILFLAETLRAGQTGPVNDAQRRQLGIVYAAALGLVAVASDIIELVRGGEGLTERTPTAFSVTEMFESVHDIVRPLAEERGLVVHLAPPAVDHRLGHPLALSRVLLNLTTNGLKYTDEGFVEIAARELDERRVEFCVRDTGRGFTEEALENLYRPFLRSADGRRQGFSGSGLGLTISRKLVAAMGSSLEVEARPGRGTRFFFELDLPRSDAADD